MTESALRCFHVTDNYDPENDMIVFAKHAIEAKRRHANEHGDGHHIAGISARRAPNWDKYAPGPVPALEMIHDGWRFECHGCSRWIEQDAIDDPEYDCDPDDPDREPMAPYEPRHGAIWCTKDCHDRDQAQRARLKRMQQRAKRIVAAAILRRWPGVTVIDRPEHNDSHVYANRTDGVLLIHHVLMRFEVPGMKHGGCMLRVHDEKWQRDRVDRIGPMSRLELYSHSYRSWKQRRRPLFERTRQVFFSCANGDKEVWEAWLAAQRETESA